MKLSYIVRSGAGYFIRFEEDGTPFLTTDPVEASRGELGQAAAVMDKMEKQGYHADLVIVSQRYRQMAIPSEE